MQLGRIGLGRMGANMVRRLVVAGHECVVCDAFPAAVDAETAPLRAPERHRYDLNLPDSAAQLFSAMRDASGGHEERAPGGPGRA